MKSNGAAERAGRQMVKGEAPFEVGKAKEILQIFAKTADTAHNYFTENAKTGEKTRAAPKIWENQADFRKRFDDWAADIKKASAQVKDLNSFKQAFETVTKACDSCHETYRLPRT
jgi:cytochrome c556